MKGWEAFKVFFLKENPFCADNLHLSYLLRVKAIIWQHAKDKYFYKY